MQTDATLLANNSQHFWMLHLPAVCTPCCMLFGVVAQSLKPVKPLNQQLPTFLLFRDRRSVAQQRWIRLHSSSNNVGSTHAHYTWSAKSYRLIETFLHCTADPNIVRSCCTRLQTTANTDATTPNIIGPTLFDFLISLRLHDYDGHCPKAAYVSGADLGGGCKGCAPVLVTFYFYELTHFLD